MGKPRFNYLVEDLECPVKVCMTHYEDQNGYCDQCQTKCIAPGELVDPSQTVDVYYMPQDDGVAYLDNL